MNVSTSIYSEWGNYTPFSAYIDFGGYMGLIKNNGGFFAEDIPGGGGTDNPNKPNHSKGPSTTVIVCSTVIPLVVVCILVIACICCRKKKSTDADSDFSSELNDIIRSQFQRPLVVSVEKTPSVVSTQNVNLNVTIQQNNIQTSSVSNQPPADYKMEPPVYNYSPQTVPISMQTFNDENPYNNL